MSPPDELDLYRPPRRVDRATLARRAARTVGVLLGSAVSLYGAALYVLRCFDTCPTDPAEDKIVQLLCGSIVLFGVLVVTAAASAGSRWWHTGSRIVIALGSVVALFGIVTLMLVPAVDSPGDHSSSTMAGVIALVVGALSAGAAFRFRAGSR